MKREIRTVHSVADPAFGTAELDDVLKYADSRKDEDVPADGLAHGLVTYHFRRLTRGQLFDFVEAGANDRQCADRAFRAGVVRITGGDFPESGWAPDGVDGKNYQAMTNDEADSLLEFGVAPAHTVDIGSIIRLRSSLGPKADPVYLRQPLSLRAWGAHARPSVEQSPADADLSSDEPNKD